MYWGEDLQERAGQGKGGGHRTFGSQQELGPACLFPCKYTLSLSLSLSLFHPHTLLPLTPTHHLKCACIMPHGEPLGFRGWAGLRREEGRGWDSWEERVPGSEERGAPGLDCWAPPRLHLARSFPGDYPCSSTSPRGQVRVQCELVGERAA